MAMHGHTHQPADDEWISLQEASALLGIAASTLRRWGDSGRLPMKRTLGGHRRFLRNAVEQLANPRQVQAVTHQRSAPAGPGWGFDTRALARQDWHTRLATRADADRMRGLGQRLLGLLIQYINRREEDDRFLSEARSIGANYGGEAREAGISMHDTVEAFLFFRGSFSRLAMPVPGIAQPHDLAEAATLHGRIGAFMDAVLLGAIDGYESDEG